MLHEIIEKGLFENEKHFIVAANWLYLHELLRSKERKVERQGLLLRVSVVDNCEIFACLKPNFQEKTVFVLAKSSLLEYVTFLMFLDDIECTVALLMLEVDPHHAFVTLLENEAKETEARWSAMRGVVIFVVLLSVVEDDQLPSYSLHITETHVVLFILFTTYNLFVLNEFLLQQPAASEFGMFANPTFSLQLQKLDKILLLKLYNT